MRASVLRGAVVLSAASLVAGGLSASSASAGPAAQAASRAATAGVARADDVRERKARLDRQIDELRESLEGSAAELVDAAVALRTAETELAGVRAELDRAQAALAQAQRRDAALAADLAYAQAEERKAAAALDAQAAAEEQTRARLGRIAREAYVGSGMTGLSIALQATSPEQFTQRMAVAGAALRSENSEVDRLVVVRSELRARGARLTALRARTAELKQLAARAVEQRRAAQDAAADAEARQARLVAARSSAVEVIRSQQEQEKARLAQAAAEQDRLARILAERAAAAERARRAARPRPGTGPAPTTPRGGGRGGSLSYPVDAPITSGFGMRFHPVLHYWRLHAGTDFGAACGTPVRAASSGTVVRAGRAGGFGNQVVLDHGYVRGTDLASSYNHLSRITAWSGRVSRGEVIGYVGTTGLSTGCHLHFEVYENGVHVNPMRWL